MKGELQEKNQVVAHDTTPDNGEEWADVSTARINHGVEKYHGESKKYNSLPPGMDIAEQDRCDPNSYGEGFDHGFGGNTDVSGDVEPQSLARGFKRYKMNGVDDQYTMEHVDLFYGEVKDEDGNVGFAERNNYLDRN